jgi:hypothetical protein
MKMKIQSLVMLLCIGTAGWPQNDSLLLLKHAQQLEAFHQWKEQSTHTIDSLKRQSDKLQKAFSLLNQSVDIKLTSIAVEQGEVHALLDEEWNKVNGSLDSVEVAISETESNLHSQASRLNAELSAQGKSTTWGIVGAVLLLVVASLALWKFIQSSSKRTQKSVADDIEKSNQRMAEQMIELDQKLAEALTGASVQGTASDDHSLALKVADEVTRIESNLAQMDSGVRGHKQLSKSVDNVKNNLLAAGYELVEMLGKPYHEGMIVEADFILDENLSEGERVITRVRKPEVRFRGEVIQVGKITVSQG